MELAVRTLFKTAGDVSLAYQASRRTVFPDHLLSSRALAGGRFRRPAGGYRRGTPQLSPARRRPGW